MIRRLYVEKKPEHRQESHGLLSDLRQQLGLPGLRELRVLQRYDIGGLPGEIWQTARDTLLSEPPLDTYYEAGSPWEAGDHVFAVEYLPGQFDQRADSARQCLQLLADCEPVVVCAEVIVLRGDITAEELDAIRRYRINPVDSREAELAMPEHLGREIPQPRAVARIDGFSAYSGNELSELHRSLGLAMSVADLSFCQQYFADEGRDPSLTEIRMLDTYWSDHCRHTTFLTEIESVDVEESELTAPIEAAWSEYIAARRNVYGDKSGRAVSLMDIALMGMKSLRKDGKLPDLEESEEVNAASIVVPVERDGRTEEWLVMFKNETHNHPTEIEPFGGAATCLGGAIRDPLSGRSYVYQAMRVTGAADPRVPFSETLSGKLPQRKICLESAHGYSSYGNQIGLATGSVCEIYHPGYVAKRMEIGAVIAAAPRAQVMRGTPEPGDIIVLVGGRTGRDGVGGATGSSKEHTETALENSAEVQKGDAPTERKLQRLFRNAEVSVRIKRCNDFGAGGVSVAIGELAPSLEIDLNAVPLKYAGLDGTEIAISESQERMAVVLDAADVKFFTDAAASENLEAVVVARVTDSGRLRMTWNGDTIVDLARTFLDTNGVRQVAGVRVRAPDADTNALYYLPEGDNLAELWRATMADLNVCSQKGLVERFDSTIGAGSVLHPFGGAERATPTEAMCALIPLLDGETTAATLMSHGFHPEVSGWSPFHGAVYAVVESVAKIVAAGGSLERTRLTLQEYFERLRNDPERWGKPFAALLGAFAAQRALGTAAIGGKDSMSGSFQNLDVPPTLVSFAVCPVDARHVISPEFKGAGNHVLRLEIPRDSADLPDWDVLRAGYSAVSQAIRDGKIISAHTIREGGVAAAVAKMSFGNRIGFVFEREMDAAALFARDFGGMVLELAPGTEPSGLPGRLLGTTQEQPQIELNGQSIALTELQNAWESTLEPVYRTRAAESDSQPTGHIFEPHNGLRASQKVARPRVVIPVFPGGNCEFDSARIFRKAGAEARELVFCNRNHADIEASIAALAEAINNSQILMLPGGFSAGDEPAGSGKFIAAVLRNRRISDAVMRLIRERDGLILGICNGFQALIKTGLLPYGEIRAQTPDCPTLTYNTLGRHVSCYVRTKVVSKLSPWLSQCELGHEYMIPMSHGEGRLVGPPAELKKLFCQDQVATQYVDRNGLPTLLFPENPNGSMEAIEGITSPCGRVFGKMGHSERVGPLVGKNIPGEKVQPVFASGVGYFL